MNLITISRQFGAGGREVGRKLAQQLGWQLFDRELLHAAAQIEHVPDAELERFDEKAVGLAQRFQIHPPHDRYRHGLETAVAKAAAAGGAVFVGRGARYLVGQQEAFHLRLVAPVEWRAARMSGQLGASVAEARNQCATIDRERARFLRYFFSATSEEPAEYDLVVNTARVTLDEVVRLVACAVAAEPGRSSPPPATGRRVITLSRELGSGEHLFGVALAERLGMQAYDRELRQEEANRLGIAENQVAQIDEQPPGLWGRVRASSLHPRYLAGLTALIQELAKRGDAIVVGRGGNVILRDDPRAFHVRLVAPKAVRVRRVMEYHWVREQVARRRIAESDDLRRRFLKEGFGVDWSDPVEYHLVVNTGRQGVAAVELVADAAANFWK